MFCHKCGKEVPSTAGFCHHCGVKLHTPTQIRPNILQKEQCRPIELLSQKSRASSKKPLIIISILAVLAFCVLLVGTKLFSKNNMQENANSVMYLEMYDKNDELIGTASGFYIENGKTLVTNYHVIDGVHTLSVMSSDRELSTEAQTVLAYDKNADIAILKCDADLGVAPLKLADSNIAKQGDKIYAVGYPLGLANTMSDGIISSRYYDEYDVDVLQITAAISPGSSGGALFNERGLVIGVTSAYYDGGQNLNIAIASNTVQQIYAGRTEPTTLSKLNKTKN